MNQIKTILILSIFCLLSIEVDSQGIEESNIRSLDKNIRYGQLPNGFNYYIKSINGPLSKLYLNFYVKVGVGQENEDQSDFAHAIEHLAYGSTKNFPLGLGSALRNKNIELRDYTASSGEITKYNFRVPQDDTETLGLALGWFRDIATGLNLLEKDIDRVRGELREEFLLKRGDNLSEGLAHSKLDAKLFPGRQSNANFLDHLKTFRSEDLRRFYSDWYRPDLMAVSIVGNIQDVDAMEERIRNRFSDIHLRKKTKELQDYDALYYKRPPQFAVVERKTDTAKALHNRNVELQLFYRAPSVLEKIDSMEGIKELIKLQLLISITNKRLTELTSTYNSFYLGSLDWFKISDLPPTLGLKITTETGMYQALQETIQVLRQLQKYGALKKEWDEIKHTHIGYIDSKDEKTAKYWIDGIDKHFKYGEALPTNKQEYLKEWLSGLTRGSFNDYVFQFLSEMPEDIGLIAPTGHKALSLTEKELRSWIYDFYGNSVSPYEEPSTPTALMHPEETAKIKEKGYVDNGIGESGARELLLANGIKVALLPGKSFRNRIKLYGFSPNGALNLPYEHRSSAINAPNIVRNSGVGKMDKFMVKRFLSANNIRVSPFIGYHETGISGSAVFEDLEKMLQLVHLYFTNPRRDATAFKDWLKREQNDFMNPTSNLFDADFSNSIKEITGDNSLSKGPTDLTRALMGTKRFEGTKQTDMDVAYKAYKKLFGNARDFTFLIGGAFDPDSIIPLLQKYLGNLPNSKSSETAQIELIPNSFQCDSVYNEISVPKYYSLKNVNYAMKFISKVEPLNGWKERLKFEILGKIAGNMGWDLRFKKGYGIYLINAMGTYNLDMKRYEFGFDLSCSKEELPLLRKECRQIVNEIKSGAISQELFEKSLNRTPLLQGADEQRRLYEHYRYGQPWITQEEKEQFIKSLTIEDIKETAKKYLKEEYMLEFVMQDESSKQI